MSIDPQTDPRVKHLRDAQRRLRSALIANADRLDKPFTDDPDKNPWDTFVRPAMRELKAAVDAIAAMPAAPVAAPPTGQAGLVLTEDERTMLAYALDQAQEKIWSEDGFTDEDQAAVTSLRRLAVETPGPETQGEAEFTEARAAFMQIGRTPSLEGLRAELRIEGWPPVVGRYCGASMGRMHDVPGHEHLLAVDPRLIFEYADDAPAVVAEPGKEN